MVVRMASTIMGVNKGALKIIGRDPLNDDGAIAGLAKIIHSTLLLGKHPDTLN